jgi:hypothetical protein
MYVTHNLMPLAVSLALAAGSSAAEPKPEEIFQQRIMPIFQSPNPSSCVQCHLAGVDLKNYILPSCSESRVQPPKYSSRTRRPCRMISRLC